MTNKQILVDPWPADKEVRIRMRMQQRKEAIGKAYFYVHTTYDQRKNCWIVETTYDAIVGATWRDSTSGRIRKDKMIFADADSANTQHDLESLVIAGKELGWSYTRDDLMRYIIRFEKDDVVTDWEKMVHFIDDDHKNR